MLLLCNLKASYSLTTLGEEAFITLLEKIPLRLRWSSQLMGNIFCSKKQIPKIKSVSNSVLF